MNKQQKYQAVCEAMEYISEEEALKRSIRPNIYIIKDTANEEVKKLLLKIIYGENIGGKQDLSYQIVAKACNTIESLDFEELDEETEFESEEASMWTDERLGYLNNMNECEIMEVLKNCGTEDINTACAIWYDNMVRNVCYQLKDYILSHD